MAGRTLEERLAAEQKRLDEQRAKVDRLKAKAREKNRKELTRKKVLAGSLLLERIQTNERLREWFEHELNGFLTRPIDRKLFGLDVDDETQSTEGDS